MTPERRLRDALAAALPRLEAISDADASRPPAEGKWSPKEVLGHLVDSASNNHGRFVRAALSDVLVGAGYDQEGWVSSQRYRDVPWRELLGLFSHLNRHLAHVMETTPPEARARPRSRHTLHELAFRAVPRSEPATLEYFMADYVDHLEHHLRQILG